MGDTVSGVGVLDKSVAILGALSTGACNLAELVERTGISRATAHRLAVALEAHGLVRRGEDGRFALGMGLVGLGRAARDELVLADAARPALDELRERTGESVQLYVRDGEARVCVATLESPHGLRTIVPLGARLPLDAGSGGRVLSGPGVRDLRTGGIVGEVAEMKRALRREGWPEGQEWIETVGEREAGVASVSAAVRDDEGHTIAAVSVSGPVDRTGRRPGTIYGPAVLAAAAAIADALGASP